MTSEKYSQQFTIPSSAIDERNHVNNLIYLQWCVEAAEAHWKAKTVKALQTTYVWYVLSHHIEYKAAAFEGEQIEVTTWVTAAEGVKSERNYSITRLKDTKVLVEASSVWCLLNAKTLRPTKITDEIRTLF